MTTQKFSVIVFAFPDATWAQTFSLRIDWKAVKQANSSTLLCTIGCATQKMGTDLYLLVPTFWCIVSKSPVGEHQSSGSGVETGLDWSGYKETLNMHTRAANNAQRLAAHCSGQSLTCVGDKDGCPCPCLAGQGSFVLHGCLCMSYSIHFSVCVPDFDQNL